MKKHGVHTGMGKSHAGFSLIELLVVVSIMSVLASIALPLTELARRRNQEEELRRALREIRTGIDTYKRLVDQGRIAKAADATGYPPSLEVLVEGVPDAQQPQQRIYILRRLPRDPLASDNAVSNAGTWGLRSYASSPSDPQTGSDVFDVYSRAQGLSLSGTSYRSW